MIVLYIVRHGETDYNKEGRYLGRTDLALNSAGIRQAEELVGKIKGTPIDAVISSPLKRTLQMAHIIAPNREITQDDHFIERSLGVYEGLTKQEAKKQYPDLYDRNITRIFNEAPLKGETIQQVQERVFSGLNELKRGYQNKKILLVTHAFIAKVINKYFKPDVSKEDFFAFVLPLARITKYEID